MDELVLEISDLQYKVGDRLIFGGVDLRVGPGESVAISGPSGSGKSTLLMCVMGLIRPDSGSVILRGKQLERLSGRSLLRHRRESVGMVFQAGELLPELAPVENVAIAGLLAGLPRVEAFSRATELLDELNVRGTSADTESLSGGERQRVAVARALINRPALLLADEPTGALDSANRQTVAELLYSLPERRQCGLVVVTHDSSVAARAQRQLVLHDGSLTPASSAAPATGVSA
ncbi:ABC transporter ATP-binding protein [Streptomyces sp. NBC_00878]|uniref:ABC transporter ATP-binding protein n=1 Tax=Streptomyces sp. NBC_00878 TaxID=2975854 RepID=UPI002256CDA7|nr:ABC transporter ATP-binding protein [Streptomyces sp. NBC_00878]MCX4908873.1 ABC transporter ATP-binding protein [Streptomyces sp. NBC_00878]